MVLTIEASTQWSNRKDQTNAESYKTTVISQQQEDDLSVYLLPMVQLFSELHAILKSEATSPSKAILYSKSQGGFEYD